MACHLRQAKAAITTLRTMVANDYKDKSFYDMLLGFSRKYCIAYLKGNVGAKSSKISMLLGCINPKLEYYVWKKMIRG